MNLEICFDLRLHSLSVQVLRFQTYQETFSNVLHTWFNTMLNGGVLGNKRVWRSSRNGLLNGCTYTPRSESLNCFNKVTSLLQKTLHHLQKCAQMCTNDEKG